MRSLGGCQYPLILKGLRSANYEGFGEQSSRPSAARACLLRHRDRASAERSVRSIPVA